MRRASVAVWPAPTVARSSTESGTCAVPAVSPRISSAATGCLLLGTTSGPRVRNGGRPAGYSAPAALTRPIPRGSAPGPFIEYKARRAGVPFIEVDGAYTSQRCPRCGHTERGQPPDPGSLPLSSVRPRWARRPRRRGQRAPTAHARRGDSSTCPIRTRHSRNR
ncbi:zinc ribbon domain-containing protein [Streptomyces vastus]|uniref:zinc ribbon domain-containing protein n=1 Tax=Streptomyces vastus TaxID=285451 RepID=UPI0031E48D68